MSTYVTIIAFMVINNSILLSVNGFNHVYLFSSITIFIALTLFCQKGWEFVTICTLNLLAVVTAYITAPALNISPVVLVALLFVFTLIAYVSFLVVKAYQYQLKNAVNKVMALNHDLVINDTMLTKSREHLYSVISSLNDIIFEFDENKVCLNVWFNELIERNANPKIQVGKKLEDTLSPDKAKKYLVALDYVIANRLPISIEFVSDYGTGQWFKCDMMPIYERNGAYTGRISASLIDISRQKIDAEALRANESLLLEAQSISQTGNWWYDTSTTETYWSKNLFTLLEIDSIPYQLNKIDYYISLLQPEDRENARSYLSSIHKLEQPQFEHKLITPEGNLKYIRIIRGEHVKDDKGKRVYGVIQDITQTRLSQKAIKVSQIELMEAQAIAKIGNWKWDLVKNDLSWSHELNRIHENSIPLSKVNNAARLIFKYIHPNDLATIKKLLRKPQEFKDTSHEYRIITPNGKIKYLSVIIGKFMTREDGSIRKIIGTIQEITERKQAEIDYRESESKYKLVLETINLAAITLDKNANVTFCNKYLANLLGYRQNEIIGMNWMQTFVPDNLRPLLTGWFENNTVNAHFENPVITRDGGQRVISWQNTISYDENGNLKETTSIGEDITDREKAKQELIWAKEMAEKSSKFKSEFLSIMSHEIRTPMNAVIGTTNLLLMENPRPEQMEYLNMLKFSGENLLAIINDILDYNKIEAGKLELNNSGFNLHQLIQKIKQSFLAKVTEKQLYLTVTIDEAIPEIITGDNMRLSQVLNNLISNAVKFTNIGGVNVKLEKESLNKNNVKVKFTVTDTGIGIPADSFNLVFDPFVQDKQVINNDYGGTGLGLAITKRLVELHNGNISITSELGRGTSFTFSITYLVSPKTITDQFITPALAVKAANLSGMSILVVDDNSMNLLIASKFLKKWHAEVDEAINGKIAVEKVIYKNYDLIIMDLQMPVMDGFEATAIIKKLYPYIPVIALTADAMPETYNMALEAGMSDYLTKPFVPQTLFEKVAKFYKPASMANNI